MMKQIRTGLIVIAVFIGIAPFATEAWSQKKKVERIGASPERVYTRPISVFRGLAKAWESGNAEAISRFAGDSKIFLNVRGIGQRGGYFSRPQVRYLFQRMFKAATPVKFKFVKYHNLDKPDRRVYGVAQRSYKKVRNNRLYQDKVYVTLRKEGERWVVAEIKTTR
ncbi:MAG: DUF4783 domain-containing protein [bacterium]|nr:MAG: DUF4783 domain-containing protein [bacterium]